MNKDTYTKVFLKSAKNYDGTEDEIKKIIWYNFRSKSEGGLRLTEQGIDFVKTNCDLKTYEIEIPKEVQFTPQVLIWLDKFIDSPYFLNKRSIIVIKEKTAFELYLFSGDVKKLGFSKAMAHRNQFQDSPV